MKYWDVLLAILSADLIRWVIVAAVKTYYPVYLEWIRFRKSKRGES